MFTGSLRETQQSEITLGDVHGDALHLLIQYCYTGTETTTSTYLRVPDNHIIYSAGTIELREDTVETLLATACLLQLTAVVNACCNFLSRQLHASNCLGFALFAEQQSCTALLERALAFTNEKFLEVCKNQEFYQLNAEQLGNLLKSDDLNVPTEQEVFHSLMEWTQHDFGLREKHIPDLLALIRLPLLPPAVRECMHIYFRSQKKDEPPNVFIYSPVHRRSR